MIDWISHSISGWQFTLPGAFVTSFLVARLYRTARTDLVPWAIFVPWCIVVLTMYRFYRGRDIWLHQRDLWYPWVVDLLVVGLLPFLCAWGVTYVAWKDRPQAARAALAGGIAAVVTLPFVGAASRLVARLLIPLFI
jgi:hypothetical protein